MAGITRIAVEGFKSIAKRQEIEIRPLTILAGANSSGKSSIMQPLLMLKQTLEATYDPGPLKIDGPNVTFTSSDQFLAKQAASGLGCLRIELTQGKRSLHTAFVKRGGLQLEEQTYENVTLHPGMSQVELKRALSNRRQTLPDELTVVPRRCFLTLMDEGSPSTTFFYPDLGIEEVIHVPSLRGNTARDYPAAGSGPNFPGLFHHYVASTLLAWRKEKSRRYEDLTMDLRSTDLALDVSARRVNDAAIEIYVQLVNDRSDNIADVGIGVSQVLPVLVALRAAEAGRLVYIEEPEIHLHPRAQTKLADILAGAAKRGVRVVVETHSTLLLTAIQTLVAKGEFSPDLVKLHWFQRDPRTGITQVTPADLDENGAFGDWPEDFDKVILDTDGAYLDAVEGRQVG